MSPWTPVEATPLARVPSYDFPIIAALPLSQPATTALPPVTASNPGAAARPCSQSMTAFMLAMSPGPPCSGQPVDQAVPLACARMTA